MTDRLGAISRRLETVHQLQEVVAAMRGIAASRVHEAAKSLDAVRAHAATLGEAIGEALAFVDPAQAAGTDGREGRRIVLVLTAEQGFVGPYCDAALDAAEAELERAEGGTADLLLAGSRGLAFARERGLAVAASVPMPLHLREVVPLANRITDELFERIGVGGVSRITLLRASVGKNTGAEFLPATLIPFEYDRFQAKPKAIPPIVTLPPDRLLAMLAEEYVFAEICEALTLAFSAENEARLHAMMAASENIRRSAEELATSYRQVRQEAITEEVLELAEGSRSRSVRS